MFCCGGSSSGDGSSASRSNPSPPDDEEKKGSLSLKDLEKEIASQADKAANLPALTIKSIKDLPKDILAKIDDAGISVTDVASSDAKLDAVLNIVHFLYKRKFKRVRPTSTLVDSTPPTPNPTPADADEVPPVRHHHKKRESAEKKSSSSSDSSSSSNSSKPKDTPPSDTQDTKTSDTQKSSHSSQELEVPKETPKETPTDNATPPNDTPQEEKSEKTEPPKEELAEAQEGRARRDSILLTEKEINFEGLIQNGDVTKVFKSFSTEGKGGFGSVERAKHIKKKFIAAIKTVPHVTSRQIRSNYREIVFLRQLRGEPNIVEYYGTYKKQNALAIIMEYMEGGTLAQALKGWKFQEPQVAYFAREVMRGLASIHNAGLAHRDIKPHNIMLDVEGAVKIIDFGLCIDVKEMEDETKSMVGSAYWMSPEMIMREQHGPPTDIYSAGIMLYELLSGKALTKQMKPMYSMYVNAIYPESFLDAKSKTTANALNSPASWSEDCRDFLKQCLTRDPAKRPTATELLNHPFLAAVDQPKEMKRILKLIFLQRSLRTQGMFI